jgi:hypothetical protein
LSVETTQHIKAEKTMSFIKRFTQIFTPSSPQKSSDFSTYITVRCMRCGEVIQGRIDLRNDLSIDYEAGDTYHCRKVLMGENRCFQKIEVDLTFDRNRKIIERRITGGEFIEVG